MVITRPFGERTLLILNETSYPGDVPTRRNVFIPPPPGRVLHLSRLPSRPINSIRERLGLSSGAFGFRSRLVPSTTTTTTTPSPVFASPAHFAAALNVEVEQTNVGGQTSRGILCLDLATGSPADAPQILLLNDTSNGILLTAVLHSSDYEGFKKFSEMRLTLNDTTAITISTKSIIVGSERFRWWQLRSVSFEGLRITDNDGIELATSDNLTLVFHKFGLQSRRSLAKPFMTVTAKNTDQLSPSASGLLVGVVGLTNVQQTSRNTLSFTKLGPNGGTRETVTSEGKTLEGERCLRVLDPSALSSILDS